MKFSKIKRFFIVIFLVLCLSVTGFLIYAADYSRAGEVAAACVAENDNVKVVQLDNGLLFDGPGSEDALIFYPGGKVEYTAYSPLMLELAQGGVDCYLVKMPFNFAFFDLNAAEDIINNSRYDNYYIGGHSLGGAMAAVYAAENPQELSGLVLLAAYPTKSLAFDNFAVLSLYGSEDNVVSRDKIAKGRAFMPENYIEVEIPCGNHAGFADYGEQKGDGKAVIPAEEQRRITVEEIISFLTIY